MPALFVLIWSTGFVVARLGMPYAPPFTFLCARYLGAFIFLWLMLQWTKTPWPSKKDAAHLSVAGVLLQAGYLGGVWYAVAHGLPAGIAALVVGLQPLLTGLFTASMGEQVRPVQWLGLFLGLAGVAITVSARWSVDGIQAHSLFSIVIALFSITAGTLYQKRHVPSFDIRAGAAIQYLASFLITLPLAWVFEPHPEVEWNLSVLSAYVWSVFALSIGAIALLFKLIERGEATRVTSLFYLTPPTTAIMAWWGFGERLDVRAMMGFGLAMLAVLLVNRKPAGA